MYQTQQANPSDSKEILELQKAAYLSEAELHNDFEIPPLTQTLDELINDFKFKKFIKILDGSKIIASGQARLEKDTCHIGRMAVWPEWQGKGIGSKLLAELEKVYPEATRFELFTGEKSASNLSMYCRRGYTEYKRALLGKTTIVFLEKYVNQ